MKLPAFFLRFQTEERVLRVNKISYSGKDLKQVSVTASALNYYLFVGEGKKRFENLTKRYSEKKNNLKRKSASGAGLADIEAAKRDLKEYGFLTWLEEHHQLRETKTNLRSIRLDDFESGSTDHSDSDDTESLNIEPDLNRARKKMKPTSICTKVSDDKANSNSNNSKKIDAVEQAELFSLQSIGSAFATKVQSVSSSDKKDANDLLGKMVSQ